MAGEEPECYWNPLNRLLPPNQLQGGRIEERFETERAIIRELSEADLEPILLVYQSNRGYIALTEGHEGAYDLRRLQLEFALANATPGRRFTGVFLRPNGEAVGVLDWMLENPTDGKLWVGLLMIRADRQRQGLAEEVFWA